MKHILGDQDTHIIVCERGEDALRELKQFCAEQKIAAGWFQMIGAAGEVEFAWYNLETKEFEWAILKEDVEIASLSGNVSTLDNDIVLHCHGVFSNRKMAVKAGHVRRLVVSGACEIILREFSGKMNRVYDENTGLNLLS
ncbi:MAG: DNA-binding protein [Candidatus Wildermuthbacteria bacterium]|nr:DNA-binding protein [Candidatus Wildermuthbacteria bacterium]